MALDVPSSTPASPKADDKAASRADELIREYERLSGDRVNFEGQWTEIAQRLWPAHSRAFQSRGFNPTQGDKRTEELYDSTALLALTRFGAILDSLLTPRNQTWHRLTTNIRELNKNREVRLWFEKANAVLFKYRYSPEANFASQNQQNYKSLGAFGTGCLFTDALVGEPGIRYRAVHLSEAFFTENHQGIVDGALRYFSFKARQALQIWGEKCPDAIKGAMATNPNQDFFFIHCVKAREDYEPNKKDMRGMKWASYYVSITGKKLMSEGGYKTFPYAISRYEQGPGEVYGRSPAMDVLPAIKTLNEEKKTILKQGHRVVDPVLLVHDDGIVDTFSLKPGAVNAGGVTKDGRPLVHTLPTGNIVIGKELMDDERQVINDAFLVNLFQILVDTPQMTAAEVMERSREKGILLAPTIGRQQSEYLGPLIDRELDVLMQQGLVDPMPQALREAAGEYQIEYDSPLSRTQRAEEAAGLMRTLETALNVATQTQDPTALDIFDWDVIMPDLADINAVPTRWLRSKEVIAAIRQGRQQQADTQTAIQAGPSVAAVMKAQATTQKGKA